MPESKRSTNDAIALVLTTLADLLNGYPVKELADGWKEAAAKLAKTLREGGDDDEGTWDVFMNASEEEEEDEDDEDEDKDTYEVVKFYQNPSKEAEVLLVDQTLAQAKEACAAPGTSGPGWFIGFRKE